MNDVTRAMVELCMKEKYFDYTKNQWVERHVDMEELIETVVVECAAICVNQYDSHRIRTHFGVEW